MYYDTYTVVLLPVVGFNMDKRLVCNYGKASLLQVRAPTGTRSYGYSLLWVFTPT